MPLPTTTRPAARLLVAAVLAARLADASGAHAGDLDTASRAVNPAAPPGFPPCVANGGFEPICGLQAPEDLQAVPGTRLLIVAQMRGPTELPDSNVAVLDVDTQAVRVLPVQTGTRVDWADATCTGPDPKPGVHGFDLSVDARGDRQLLVVNHGSRESIEVYRLVGDGPALALEWRGCVATPADVRLNDVASLPGGGFITSVMGESRHFEAEEGFGFLMSGANTGWLLEWTPRLGFRRLPGSDAAFPNGVAVDASGRHAYVAAFAGRYVLQYDLAAGRKVADTPVDLMPDNLTWAPDGTLLTAGILDMADVQRCFGGRTPFCSSRFRVARIDPFEMRAVTIVDGPDGVLGGASCAVEVGDRIYVGAWSGDRIVRTRHPEAP